MIIEEIKKIKERLGDKLVIPVHHYQAPELVSVGDFVGDSYKLAVECSKTTAEYVAFCGVYFMAECADILNSGNQKVVMPVGNAGCPMADMADIKTVTRVFDALAGKLPGGAADIAPIVYMNSYADLKSFCGEHGGSVCTSSNANIIMKHYLDQGKKILFFPDCNLGVNTAMKLGLEVSDTISSKDIEHYNGEQVILWEGFCPIHMRFTPSDVDVLRADYPGIKIIVHPESTREVVAKSDDSGSTEYILSKISKSPAGSVWGVGTETVFVNRLATEFPDKTIVPLRVSECVNMKKTTAELLLECLKNIEAHIDGNVALKNNVVVLDEYKKYAADSLNKMIAIVEQAQK